MTQLSSIQFDPMSPEFRANPYPYYQLMLQHAPIFFRPDWNMWFVARYDDVVKTLREPRFGREYNRSNGTIEIPESMRPLVDMQWLWMLLRDPPDHTRLRGLVHKAFTPKMIEQMRERVQATADRLIDAVEPNGALDVIADLAKPLPVTVIAEMIGVPAGDHALFRRWSDMLAPTLDLDDREETYLTGTKATVEFTDYLHGLIAERRARPQDDLLTALIAAEEAGDRLTEAELIATVILLLLAGHETTTNLIGNGTLALLRHPDQLVLLRDNPTLARGAVEELLRYDSPVQLTGRTAADDVEIGGQIIQAGQYATTLIGAANHDPAQFADPDRLDITRADNHHLAFGNGIHFCLGAPLARMEGQIAFNTLLRRLPTLTLADDQPTYRDNLTLRGLNALPVTF